MRIKEQPEGLTKGQQLEYEIAYKLLALRDATQEAVDSGAPLPAIWSLAREITSLLKEDAKHPKY